MGTQTTTPTGVITSTAFWEGYSTVSGTEEATIASVDAGGYCLDLTTPLQHDHLAEERSTVGPEAADSAEYRDHRVVQMRAEVALLT